MFKKDDDVVYGVMFCSYALSTVPLCCACAVPPVTWYGQRHSPPSPLPRISNFQQMTNVARLLTTPEIRQYFGQHCIAGNSKELQKVAISRLAGWWRHSLKTRPVLTNTIVYASFYTAAELSQQTFNKIYAPEKPELDFKSAGRIAAVGSTLYAPTLYFWYKLLDRKFVGTSTRAVLTKVASDQFLMTPVLLAGFYILIGTLEGKEDVLEELKQKYWKTFIANQAFWIPGQIINFAFVPPNLRVVYVASASFLWINILCFIKRQKVEVKEA